MLATISGTLTAGCIYRTGDPPPFPQPTFEYTYDRTNGTTVLTVTVVDGGGMSDEPLRILVDDTVAYENGSFCPPYENSSASENEWADGIEGGESTSFPVGNTTEAGVEVEIRLRRSDTGELVTVGGGELKTATPSPERETTTARSD